MLRLFYSNRTEALVEALAVQAQAEREQLGPLSPLRLVVPNRHMAAYARLGIAQHAGVAANLQAAYLERCLVDLATQRNPQLRVVTGPTLVGSVVELLCDEASLAHEELAPVRAYLSAAGAGDARERRRAQLAAHVAQLFEAYGASRPELLDVWPQGPALGSGPAARVERWQRRLWLGLFGSGGWLEQRFGAEGRGWITLPRLLARIDAYVQLPPQPLHLFGFSYFARAFHGALARLALQGDLYVYALNPCREFWEDVETERERRRRRRGRAEPAWSSLFDDPGGPRLDEMPLLAAWGRPGREAVLLLNQLTEGSFEDRFVALADAARPQASVLVQLQDDLLQRKRSTPAETRGAAWDGSIQLLSCPSMRREAEAVAAEIWRLVRDSEASDRPLRFNEIAVLVNQPSHAEYLPHLLAAFEENHQLPQQVLDLPMASDSRVAEALELLLDLPFGSFTRRQLLRIMTHPVVAARFSDLDPEAFVALAAAAGIVHGADREDHADTYIEGDLLNWDQGIRRLALGCVASGDGLRAAHAELPLLPVDPGAWGGEAAASFGLLARSLIRDARFLREQRLGLGQWAELLSLLASTYLVPASDADEQELLRCLESIDKLAALEVTGQAVPYRVAVELLRRELGRLERSRGHFLADGVVISSFMPMRAIPFRATFVLGLSEGAFPAREHDDALDLRQQRRQPGDVSARERDLYMLLETLLCTRERLYLSYVGREPLSAEPVAPAPPVQALCDMLGEMYPARDVAALVRAVPDARHLERAPDASDDAMLPPAAEAESKAAALRADLERHAGGLPPRLAWDLLASGVDAALWPSLRALLGVHMPGPVTPGEAQDAALSVGQLRQFLECPLQGHARAGLGLQEEDEDDAIEIEDEQLEAAGLDRVMLLRRAFLIAIRQGLSIEQAYAAEAARLVRLGELPSGILGSIQADTHLRVLEGWRRAFGSASLDPGALRVHRFGTAPRADAERGAEVWEAWHPPLALEVPWGGAARCAVHVQGRTGLWVEGDGPASAVVLLPRARMPKSSTDRPRDVVRAGIEQAVCAAAGLLRDEDSVLHVCASDGDTHRVYRYRLAAWTPEAARRWLTDLAADLLAGPHPYLLPCEAVLEACAPWQKQVASIEATVTKLVGSYDRVRRTGGFSSTFGPVPDAERYPCLDADAAERVIARRFGPLLERLERLDDLKVTP